MSSSPYESTIWSMLLGQIGNEIGTAALMGNLEAESNLIPYRLQNDFTTGYTKSLQYTNEVNLGIKSRYTFYTDGKGYGLAQWTFSSRKRGLYDYFPLSTYSIGDLNRQIPFMVHELQTSYSGVWNTLVSATSLKAASDKVLTEYENPAVQTEEVKEERYSLALQIYANNHGTGPTPPTPGPTPPGGQGIPKWLMLKIGQDSLRKRS